ncbi:hypothetical protein HMN09_00312500 [Mycena chlorophos]|uniref:Transmembrane protein 135 N-terminal domain-containing protein n=1 Tax=Mycena chlorophos TaxID=658473 RepID=A0A8H6WKG8_MYCCL|nr:hypothetical protein HMN09_00312500 [Mycena chlorophos]
MAALDLDPPPLKKRPRLDQQATALSFDNVVSLAIYQQERLKDARQILWREKGQPVVQLNTLRECLEHAVKGGARSATLAFTARACFSLLLALIRIRKIPRSQWLALVRHAIFGEDSFRFATMMGAFATLYKLLVNALPILFPTSSPVDDSRSDDGSETQTLIASPSSEETETFQPLPAPHLSLSAHAQLILGKQHSRRWHAALAGAVAGGLAVMCEKQGRRAMYAQQLFVRGLQGFYNNYSERWGIHVPHGASIVFALSVGQIMFAFFLRPDTLPKWYNDWIQMASHSTAEGFSFNRQLVQDGIFDISALDKLIARPNTTTSNRAALQVLRERIISGDPTVPRYLPCEGLHQMTDGCVDIGIRRFFVVGRWMLPVYAALHFVPSIALRWKMFRADPLRVLLHAGIGSLKSSAFLGAFVSICQAVWCIKHNLHQHIMSSPALQRLIPKPFIDMLVSRYSWWFAGLMTGLSLFFEDERRRGELAMYTLPKALESLWVVARGRGLVGKTGNWGESALAAFGSGMVMMIYQHDPEHLSSLVRRLLYQFVGPN